MAVCVGDEVFMLALDDRPGKVKTLVSTTFEVLVGTAEWLFRCSAILVGGSALRLLLEEEGMK